MPEKDENVAQQQHFSADEALQRQQNELINRNTRITFVFGISTLVLGVLALLAEIVQVIVEINK